MSTECRKCWQKRIGITQSGTPLLRWHDAWCALSTEYDRRRLLLTPAEIAAWRASQGAPC